MTIAITAATGQYARRVLVHLVERGIEPASIVAIARSQEKAADLAQQGFEVRIADYNDRAALTSAFTDIERVLFVSGSDVGQREQQHENVIEAAKAAGVAHVIYTSMLRADTAAMGLRADHVATEALLGSSGLATTLLRHGWYGENYFAVIAPSLASGTLLAATGSGRVSAATRDDFAAAGATVLAEGSTHEGRAYELAGEVAFSMDDLAAWITAGSGVNIAPQLVSEVEYRAILEGAGQPAPVAAMIADIDASIARGDLEGSGEDLRRLIGREPQSVETLIKQAAADQSEPS